MPIDDVTVRRAVADDAPTIAGLRAAAVPYLVMTAAGMRARLVGPRAETGWLASVHGTPVGYAVHGPATDGVARGTVVVHPQHRRLGVGSALLDVLEDDLIAAGTSALAGVADDEAGRAFAVARGAAIGREHRFAVADLAAAPEPPAAPGVQVLPLAHVATPRAIWTVNAAAAPDDPSGLSVDEPYEEWLADEWSSPDHALDLGVAASVGGEVVAFTLVLADRERGAIWSAMTGVHPVHRGRGLARLVKAHAFRAARDAGLTQAFTANDATNAPMLAVNTWLGYRPAARAWSVHQVLDRADGLRH